MSCSFFIFSQQYKWERRFYLDSTQILETLKHRPINISRITLFFKEKNISSSVKNRLLSLIDYKWSVDEYEIFVNFQRMNNKESFISYAKELSKNDNLRYLMIYDSLVLDQEKTIRDQVKKTNFLKVNDNILKTTAFLDFPEAKDLLTEHINDSIHYNTQVIKLCLARLGEIKFQNEIIKNCSYVNSANEDEWLNNYKNIAAQLIFIASQESVYHLKDWLVTNRNVYNPLYIHIHNRNGYTVVSHLISLIKNQDFVDGVSKYVDLKTIPDDWENIEVIDFCKNWLIKNKGNYIINRNFYPY